MSTDNKKFYSMGVMSGTSTDGLDLAVCFFEEKNDTWNYKIISGKTIAYTPVWMDRLRNAHKLNAYDFLKLHNRYGVFIGKEIKSFLYDFNSPIDFISSHGHTIFHQPDERFTFQLGAGASIAAVSNITTISDFRVLDVALGGNGAPLVPIGDEVLFSKYDFCLNLGGFANISFKDDDKRIAYDICPANIILNLLANKKGLEYDNNGELGKEGKIDQDLLEKLNGMGYYSRILPKSLSREWLESDMLPIIDSFDISIPDKLRTLYEHISIQIYNAIEFRSGKNVLITGGGAFNTFLMHQIKKYLVEQYITIPNDVITQYKEALIFAFLGVLRFKNQPNCLATVTGASFNNIGGVIHQID